MTYKEAKNKARYFVILIFLLFDLGYTTVASESTEREFIHVVFFNLVDDSAKATEKLVSACKEYLSGHDGTVYFSVGSLAQNKVRGVNIQDFDVSLIIVFETEAAQDNYQTHPRHKRFIAEHQGNWEEVKVFDSIKR